MDENWLNVAELVHHAIHYQFSWYYNRNSNMVHFISTLIYVYSIRGDHVSIHTLMVSLSRE